MLTSALTPQDLSQRASALSAIRTLILSGQISPGVRTSERRLTQTFLAASGLGRTPVREALAILTVQGLVVQYPQSGFIVPRISARTAQQALRLQQLTQSLVITQVASQRLDTSALSRFTTAMQQAASAHNSPLLLDHARAFHLDLARTAGYNAAAQALGGFRDLFSLFLVGTTPLRARERTLLASVYRQLVITLQEDADGELSRARLEQIFTTEVSFITARAC
jgi:DNA-binding GntR family transcriptional regulator